MCAGADCYVAKIKKCVFILLFFSGIALSDQKFDYEKYDDAITFRDAVNNLVLPGMDFEKVNEILTVEGVYRSVDTRDKNTSSYRYDYKSSRWWMFFAYQHWIIVMHVDAKTNKVILVRTNYGITGL